MATYIIWELVISVSWKVDGMCRQDTHSQYTAIQFVHKRGNAHEPAVWSLCAWKESVIWCCTCLIRGWFTCRSPRAPHLPLSLSFPTTTAEHAAQSGQHINSENTKYITHLQAPSVDKLRNQESLWHENLQSGGNPRTTTPTKDSTRDVWGSSKWLLGHNKRNHLSSSSWTQSQTVPAERRIISHSAEVQRRYQHNTYVTRRVVGEKYWRLLERGWRKRIVRCMDKLQKIHFIEQKTPWRIHMVRGVTYEENKQPLVQTMCGQICGSKCLMQQKRKEN